MGVLNEMKSCSLITFEGHVMAAAVSPGFIQCWAMMGL
jgi:hypothetical protein